MRLYLFTKPVITTMEDLLALAEGTQLLISRLERLSADSIWAHRASGVRGTLLRGLDKLENAQRAKTTPGKEELDQLQASMDTGFSILEKAAKELI